MNRPFTLFWKLLGFLPAVAVTAVFVWIYHGFADIPFSVWLVTAAFYLSGLLLCFGQFYGGIAAMILPVADYLHSLSGYAGMRHVDTLPLVILLGAFYTLCGVMVWRNRKRA